MKSSIFVATILALLADDASAAAISIQKGKAISVAKPTSTSATAAIASPAYDGTYINTVLKHHNVHRANHTAPALSWGSLMAQWAQTWAAECKFAHNTSIGTKGYGQNIAAGTQPSNISLIISDEFYNGEVNAYNTQYGQATPDMELFEGFGHFTQVVWKGTVTVGCATVNCAAKGGIGGLSGMNVSPWMTVCNYYPPGNYLGEFGSNVGDSQNHPTVTGYY